MKINFTVRFRNPMFWLTIIPAFASFVYTLLGCFGVVPAVSQDAFINALTAIITALTTFGVLVDPTTKGASDSDRAMSYKRPN